MRKLVFFSDQIITDKPDMVESMRALIGQPNPRVGYIPSCADPRRAFFETCQADYRELGMDLSVYFELDVDYQPEKLEALLACSAIHLSGGNTYHFLYWLRQRGMLAVLRKYVADGGVLIGVSAGAILMTPSIAITNVYNDQPYPGEKMADLSALGLVDFAFLPHMNHLAAPNMILQEYSNLLQSPVYGCNDGDGIITNGDDVQFFGSISKTAYVRKQP